MFTSATAGPQESVTYFDGSPTLTKYAAGSRSWRTSNPGLIGLGVIAAQHGAIGQALGVAVFQNPQQGRNALAATLADESFQGMTVEQMLKRFIPGYTPPPRETDATGEPLPWIEPETNTDLELTMSAVGGKRQQIAALIEQRIGFIPGIVTKEAMDTGTLNQSQRSSGSPGNLLINGRSSVHAGSGGTLSTIDVCKTPRGDSCPPQVYTNIAVSSDAAKTATSVKVNGNPACTQDSIFSKSSGDDPGRCGGVRSGTLRAKAEVVTSASNVLMEGKGALRQFDLMVSNNQNTPPAPVQQGGGARPDFLDTVGAQDKEETPSPWRFDWQVTGGKVRQLNGRWVLQTDAAHTDLDTAPIGGRDEENGHGWTTTLEAPADSPYDYALRLPDTTPRSKAKPYYDIPFRHYMGSNSASSPSRSAEAKASDKEIAVPVVIGLYGDPTRNSEQLALPELGPGELSVKARAASPLNQGWLYIYVDGFLWRELEVCGGTIDAKHNQRSQYTYVDVNLTQHMGNDIRPATIQPVHQLLLPHKVAGQKVKVEIAYARVQWSWSRLVGYGGIHPSDPRWENNAPVCLPQSQWGEATQRRSQRMQRVDLSGYASNWPTQAGNKTRSGIAAVDSLLDTAAKEYLTAHQGQGLPMLLLDDPLGWAKDKAYAYQQSWRDMEEYIADLSNPNHEGEKKQQFPFAPWFDSAVLANRYFFAPAPDLDAPNISKDQRIELVRAMDERNEWKRQLDLHDIQTALGNQHRKKLREKIKAAKQPLVDCLDETNPELERLTAVLDDWFALPAKPKGPLMIPDGDKTPCYGDHFVVMEELIARLADDEYALDLQLETEPPTTQQQYALQQNDPGRIFLRKLASAGGGHPLHSRLFPKQAGDNRYAYIETQPEIPEDFDTGKLQNALAIGRRNVKILREFINHFNTLAEKGAQEVEAVVRLIAAGLLEMPLEELEITLKELVEGHLEKLGYALAGEILIDSRDPISHQLAEHYAKFAENKRGAKGAKLPIGIYQIDGATYIGSTKVENLRNGSAASSTSWVRELDPHADLGRIRLRVPAFKLSLAQKLKRSPVVNTSVLGGIALLEVWNVAAASNALMKQYGKQGEGLAWAKFGEAVGGLAATAGMFRDEFVKRAVAERSTLIEASPKITASSDKIARRMKPILNTSARWANGLGFFANAYSTFMSAWQMTVNISEGDDAAISYGVLTIGFGMGSVVAFSKTLLAIGALKDTALAVFADGIVSGPLGWISLLLILAGTALLIWVYRENSPLDWWLKHGPFSRPENPRQQTIPREDGTKWLVGPKQNALKLDASDRIQEVIDDNPYGLFHTTPEGAVVARQGDDYRIIGFKGDPIDKDFLAEFDAPRIAQRFNGHTPGFDPEDQYGWWYEHPQSAAKALADAVFSPKVTLNHRKATRADVPDMLEIRIDLGAFIDGKSLLFAELWRTDKEGQLKDKPGEDKVRLCTGEGSGPKTVRVEWPIAWSNPDEGIEHVCARVRLDLNGDGSMCLPMPLGDTGAIVTEEIPAKEEVECVAWRWEEVRTALHMHRGKWEKLQTDKGNASYLARRERFEARLKQEKGAPHD